MTVPRDHLVAALHQRGICYLAPSPHGDEPHLNDDELLIGLAGSKDGRLRFALAGLLLVHPELVENLIAIVETHTIAPINAPIVQELKRQYVAAAYLQRMWRTRLNQRFGDTPLMEDRFTGELNLPASGMMNGKLGLRTLTDASLFNDWSSYEQVVDMICDQPCVHP